MGTGLFRLCMQPLFHFFESECRQSAAVPVKDAQSGSRARLRDTGRLSRSALKAVAGRDPSSPVQCSLFGLRAARVHALLNDRFLD